VNGALNILRKVIGDGFSRKLVDRGCWFQPVRIRDVIQTSHQQFVINFVLKWYKFNTIDDLEVSNQKFLK